MSDNRLTGGIQFMSVRFAFRFPDNLASDLREYAAKEGNGLTDVVVTSVDMYIHRDAQIGTQDAEPDVHADTQSGPKSAPLVDALLGQLSIKDEQLRAKDEQIRARDQQISGMMTLMAMAQTERKKLPWVRRVKSFFTGEVSERS